jgi:hypothetical protein
MRPQHSKLHSQSVITHHTESNDPIMKPADQLNYRRALTVRYSKDHYTEQTVRELLDRAAALLTELATGRRARTGEAAPR